MKHEKPARSSAPVPKPHPAAPPSRHAQAGSVEAEAAEAEEELQVASTAAADAPMESGIKEEMERFGRIGFRARGWAGVWPVSLGLGWWGGLEGLGVGAVTVFQDSHMSRKQMQMLVPFLPYIHE